MHPKFGGVLYLQVKINLLQWSQRGIRSLSKKEKETKNEASQKCEKMNNEKKTGYIIYDFMKEDLKLTGVTLKVYALIYSFTKAGSECYGSIDYISTRVGASYRSVQKSLRRLVEKGYVIKRKTKANRPNVYLANTDLPGKNCRLNELELPTDSVKSADDNKEDNINNTNLLTNHSFSQAERQKLQPFGKEKVVMLTFHHYVNLLRAVGVLPTFKYIEILEKRIIARKGVYNNHYKTIITWARQDHLISPEGEIILEN